MMVLFVIFFMFFVVCFVMDFFNKENIECNELFYLNMFFYIFDLGFSGMLLLFLLFGNLNDGLMFCEKVNDIFYKLFLVSDNKKDLFVNYFKDVLNFYDMYNIVKVLENGLEWIFIGIFLFVLVLFFVIFYV